MSNFPQIVGDQNRPASIHAEMTILGAMLIDDVARMEAMDLLQVGDFALDSHRRIFSAIIAVQKSGSVPDLITVTDYLAKRKELDSVGGLPYVADLSTGLPRKLSIESYVRIVRDKGLARGLMEVAERGVLEASDGQEEAEVVRERLIRELSELGDSQPGNDLQSAAVVIEAQGSPEAMVERMATLNGIRIGFEQVDRATHGLQPKSLVIIAARPSMGKTAAMCRAARHSSVIERKITAVFPLEQDKDIIIRRMLSIEAKVPYDDVLSGKVTPHDARKLHEQREMLMDAPLYFDDTPGLTVSRMKSKCARLKRTVGLDIVYVDQLSKVSNADVYQKGMPKSEWVGKQCAAFKLMAQELEVPVVLLNQLKRPDGKGGNTPQLSDLKESGSLEEDADVVIFLHRPEYYDRDDENLKGKGQMILAKNREGVTDTFDCIFSGSMMRWDDGSVDPQQAYFDAYQSAYRD